VYTAPAIQPVSRKRDVGSSFAAKAASQGGNSANAMRRRASIMNNPRPTMRRECSTSAPTELGG